MSEKWFRIALDNDAVADGQMGVVIDAFESIMPDGNDSRDCALFSTHEADDVVIYVSPEFAKVAPALITRFGAVESQPPPPMEENTGVLDGTSLLLASHSRHAISLLR